MGDFLTIANDEDVYSVHSKEWSRIQEKVGIQ